MVFPRFNDPFAFDPTNINPEDIGEDLSVTTQVPSLPTAPTGLMATPPITAALVAQVVRGISEKRFDIPGLGEVVGITFLSPEQALNLGITIEEGFQLKLIPGETRGSFTISMIDPLGWELTQEDLFISPEGQTFTRAEMQALGLTEAEAPLVTPNIDALLSRQRALQLEIEAALTSGIPRTELVGQFEELAALQAQLDTASRGLGAEAVQLEAEFSGLITEWRTRFADNAMEYFAVVEEIRAEFPGMTEDGIRIILGRLPQVARDMIEDIWPDDFRAVIAGYDFGGEGKSMFFTALLQKGRNSATEELIGLIYGDITENQMRQVFGEALILSVETWAEGRNLNLWPWERRITPENQNEAWAQEEYANYIKAVKAAPHFARVLETGYGNLLSGIGGGARYFGADGIADRLQAISAEHLAMKVADLEPQDFNWTDIWIGAIEMLPTTFALAGTSIAAFIATKGVLTPAIGAFSAYVIAAVTSGLGAAALEGALEAGGAYDAWLAANPGDVAGAKRVADEVFLKNVALLGVTNIAELAAIFVPGGRLLNSAVLRGLIRVVRNPAGKITSLTILEGGQEGIQEYITRTAAGEEVVLDDEMKLVIILGGLMGGILGGGGIVYQHFQNRVAINLEGELRTQFDADKITAITEGMTEIQAVDEALNNVVGTVEGKKIIDNVLEASKIDGLERATVAETEIEIAVKEQTFRKIREEAGVEEIKPAPPVEPVPAVEVAPVTEPGMPEAGLQRSMLPEEISDKEVRPAGKGRVVQISMEDQLKLEQARRAAEEASADIKETYEAQETIEGLKVTHEADPIATARFKLGGRNVSLLSFISIREQTFPETFTVKQAEALRPGHTFTNLTPEGRVPRDAALDDLSKQFNMTPDAIADRVMEIRQEKNKISQLESSIKEQFTEKPLTVRDEVTPEEAAENLAITGQPKLTLKQVDALVGFFADYLDAPNTITAWELTRELRRETLAGRAENLKARAQELVISEGLNIEDALKQAVSETMAGKLPVFKTEYLQGLTNELRDALFAKVYHTLKNEPFEMMSTVEALTNALTGKPIPREPGVRGGSAYSRLLRVFGDQPKVLRMIDKMAKENKPLEDIIEGVWRISGQDPIPLDQTTVNYLRNLATKPLGQTWLFDDASRLLKLVETKSAEQIRTETELLQIELAPEPTPPSLPPVEPPVAKGMEQMPMIPAPQKHILIRALKEVGATVVDIGSFMRANMASFDFSFWRQQGPLILNNKIAFINANITAWKATWSQQAMEASWARITRDPLYQLYVETDLDFLRPPPGIQTGTEHWKGIEEFGFVHGVDRPIPKFTSRLPHVKLSARAFATGTNEHNWRIFKDYYSAMLQVQERIASGEVKLKPGEAFSMLKELEDYGKMLMDFTGRASLGKIGPAAPALASLFFAPRLNLGRLLTPKHLISANPRVRRAAWQNITTFVGGVGGILLLGQQLGLWEVEWDCRSPNFAQIRIGNVRFDPWGGFRPFVVFFCRVLSKTGLSGATGAEYAVDPLGAAAHFMRGKAAPLAAVMIDFLVGKNFIGEEVDIKNPQQWIERVAPFAFRDVFEVYMRDPLLALFAVVPAFLGAGITVYSGDWEENFPKLGLPKYPENLLYGITEPAYDTQDFYADTARLFRGVDPETLTLAKGFPPYIKALVEAARIKEGLSLLPNQSLISINADIVKGTTFIQYYQMWLEREKLVAAGDEDKLKAFDQDERTRNAHLGNMTQQQYALLVEYHSIIDGKKQAEFLERHKDEIGTNLRHAWLVAHPSENAQLALWGQAKILTLAAYKEVQKLFKELGIPANALPEFLLPPETSIDTHFAYEDYVAEGRHASWEAQLLLAKDAQVAGEAGVESYAEWRGLTLSVTPLRALELKVEHRSLFDEYNGYADKDSPFYIDDRDERTEARDKLRADNPEWGDDIRRIEAIENLATDSIIEEWVERGRIVDEFSAGSSEAKVWLVDHPDAWKWALEQELLTDDGKDWNVPVLRINAKWREQDDAYDAIQFDDGTEQRDEREKYLLANPEYARARRRRDAWGFGFPALLIEDYVNYYMFTTTAERNRFLLTHQLFYQMALQLLGWKPKTIIVPGIIPISAPLPAEAR